MRASVYCNPPVQRNTEFCRMNWLKRWWPALLWAVVISGFSTGTFTSDNTSRIIIPILQWLLPHASMATLMEIHHLIRKCGHFTEYFILSVLILRGIRCAGRREAHFAMGVGAGDNLSGCWLCVA